MDKLTANLERGEKTFARPKLVRVTYWTNCNANKVLFAFNQVCDQLCRYYAFLMVILREENAVGNLVPLLIDIFVIYGIKEFSYLRLLRLTRLVLSIPVMSEPITSGFDTSFTRYEC